MLGRKFGLGVAAATLALGTGLGSGAAMASAGPAQSTAAPTISQTVVVLSDTINFSGTAVPTGVVGAYSLMSNQCSLTSDGEPVVFPCTITLQFNLNTLVGTGHVTSADGVVQWAFKLVPMGVVNTYSMMSTCSTGAANACYEIDSDGPASVQYPATVSGTVTIAPTPGTALLKVTGKLSVYESPTAP